MNGLWLGRTRGCNLWFGRLKLSELLKFVKTVAKFEQTDHDGIMSEEQKTERVQLMMTPSELKAIDEWSFEARIRGRSEAIRRLIEAGINAISKQRSPEAKGVI